MTRRLQVWGVTGIGEVHEGDDLAALIAAAEPQLRTGDVVVVTSKVVSKAEGRLVRMDRQEAISAETVRVVAERGDTRIVQTRHGFVLAAAGVDASNVPPGHVALLPEDPDDSARRIRSRLQEIADIDVGVVVTDTFGRPWRNGLVDVAIGAAGVTVLDDHRGRSDRHGHALEMTVTAVADEVAAAAELVKGKLDDVPVAVVRGLEAALRGRDNDAQALVRSADEDMFRLGTREAMRAALFALDGEPPGHGDAVSTAIAAAGAAARPDSTAVRFAVAGTQISCFADGDPDAARLAAGAAIGNLLLALALEGIRARWLPGAGDAIAVIALD